MKNLIREIPLQNGLTLRFFDATRRYFGDYHQVRIEINCQVPLTAELFDDHAAWESALRIVGEKVEYRKEVERQGVATDAIAGVVEEVIRSFTEHSLAYLQSPSFPGKLAQAELNRVKGRKGGFMGRSHG
jgi:hypothetical protein